MIYKRHCILTLRQRARASTSPDTLFDAYEATASTLAEISGTSARARVRLTTGYRARVHRAQFLKAVTPICCTCADVHERTRSGLDLATLPIRYSARRMRMRARHRKHARRQSRLALRASRKRSQAQDDAGPAQRSRGRKLEATAPQPAPLENALRTG